MTRCMMAPAGVMRLFALVSFVIWAKLNVEGSIPDPRISFTELAQALRGNRMARALITTMPFGDKNRLPLELLESAGIEYRINPLGRRLKEQELAEMVADFDV